MATRSFIAKKREDSLYDGTYCHFDGYPEYVGRILEEHYINEEKITALIQMGYLRSLNVDIEYCSFLNEADENNHQKLDRKELREVALNMGCDYLYIWNQGIWETIEL
jgi:hypothetical protein